MTQLYKRSVLTGLGKGDSGQFCYTPEASVDGGFLAQAALLQKVEIWKVRWAEPPPCRRADKDMKEALCS